MEPQQPEKLSYASVGATPPLSRMAVISFAIALLSPVVCAVATHCLQLIDAYRWGRATDRLGFWCFAGMAAAGLIIGGAGWLRIRLAGGALRGRPIALIAITINALWVASCILIASLTYND